MKSDDSSPAILFCDSEKLDATIKLSLILPTEVTVDDGLATAMHATRAAAHSQLEYCSPRSIAFGCDMVLNIPFHMDLIILQDKRQQKIDTWLVHANAWRTHHDFQPGMKVYVLMDH